MDVKNVLKDVQMNSNQNGKTDMSYFNLCMSFVCLVKFAKNVLNKRDRVKWE